MVPQREDKRNLNFISSERFISDETTQGLFRGSNTFLLKTHAPQALFFWKAGVNEYSQERIASVGFSRVGFSTPQTH